MPTSSWACRPEPEPARVAHAHEDVGMAPTIVTVVVAIGEKSHFFKQKWARNGVVHESKSHLE